MFILAKKNKLYQPTNQPIGFGASACLEVLVVKRIFEYSNIRSIDHIRIFFKSHSSIRDVTSNAVHVHTMYVHAKHSTVQCVQPACDFVLHVCTCMCILDCQCRQTTCEPSQAKRWLRHNFWKFLFPCQSDVYLSNFHQENFGAHLKCICAINTYTLRTCHSIPGINDTKDLKTGPNSQNHGTPSGDKA